MARRTDLVGSGKEVVQQPAGRVGAGRIRKCWNSHECESVRAWRFSSITGSGLVTLTRPDPTREEAI